MMTETCTLHADEYGMVTVGGRRFPTVTVICPQDPDAPARDDASRSLGGTGPGDGSFWIPTENGMLLSVEDWRPAVGFAAPGRLELSVYARTCTRVVGLDEAPSWLPWSVGLAGGVLSTDVAGVGGWIDAEPEWVVETIDRLSRRPFTQPPGPEVRLVRRIGEPL